MIPRLYARSLILSAFVALSCLLPDLAVAAGSLSQSEMARLKQSTKIEPAAFQKVGTQGKARVLIVFEVAPQTGPNNPAGDRRAAIRTTGDHMLGALRGEFALAHRFEHVNALAGEVSAAGLLRLEGRKDVLRVGLDLPGQGAMDEVRAITQLDILNSSFLTGQGVTVAVLDSGIDRNHSDLNDDLVAEQCFCTGSTGCCPNGGTQQSGPGSAQDDYGHGTAIAGTITGAGNVAPQGGAPDAGIVAIKVLAADGTFCCTSDIVAGLDWILANRPDVDFVNMSLGTFALYDWPCDQEDASTMALSAAINTLRNKGVSVFVATGNQGSSSQTAAPSCIQNALAVAATYDGNHGPLSIGTCTDPTTAVDQVTCFSNTGMATDLLAPGALTTTTSLGGGFSTYAGTSMAAPVAAACAAVLLQHDPYLRPRQIQRALRTSPVSPLDPRNNTHYPRLDCLAAYNASFPIFADVPASYWARDWIEELYDRGITAGCSTSPLQYCPGSVVTREQMAVFLLRAQSGRNYTPPPCIGLFDDVPCSNSFAPWIEELYRRGITAGCTTPPAMNYCPGSPVNREQMAVFLLRALFGGTYVPPTCTGIFADTPCSNPLAPWIEEIYRRGITVGCSTTPLSYCPASDVTRDQMAVFIVRAFGY